MTVDEKLVEAIEASAITTIDDVITLMRAIDGIVPRNDGLKWFNLLYLRVTESLQSSPPTQGWDNPQFLERLAAVFAGLYFTAAANWQRDRTSVPRSWLPLFMSRPRRGIVRVQFAIAGMNAHINHDLPIALVQASEDEGITPRGGSPEHRDFVRVNAILQTVADRVKGFLATGVVGEIDQDLGRLDDVVAAWSIRKARETAWTNSEILWTLRNIAPLHDAFLENLDRIVGLVTQGLLTPLP